MAATKSGRVEIVLGEGLDDALVGYAEGMTSAVQAYVQLSGSSVGIDLDKRTEKELLPSSAWRIPSVRRDVAGRIVGSNSMRGLEECMAEMVRQVDDLLNELEWQYRRGGRSPLVDEDPETGETTREATNAEWQVDSEDMGKAMGHLIELQGTVAHWTAKLPLERRRGLKGMRTDGHERRVLSALSSRIQRQTRHLIWLMSRPPRQGWI
jgi:hypothetical protein